MLMQIIGWLSSALLAVCAIPAAISAIQSKRVEIAQAFLICWLLGELLGLPYAVYLNSWPLFVNYSVNLACISILLKYNRGSK